MAGLFVKSHIFFWGIDAKLLGRDDTHVSFVGSLKAFADIWKRKHKAFDSSDDHIGILDDLSVCEKNKE